MSSTTTKPLTRTGDQWLRWCSLRVGPKGGGDGIDLSALRIDFAVTNPIVSTPGAARIRVYNVAPSTVGALLQFNPTTLAHATSSVVVAGSGSGQLLLDAGYENGQQGNIFTGEIVQVRAGRENETDTYVDLYAQDGDAAITRATMNTTLAKGWAPEDARQRIAGAMGAPSEPLDVQQTQAPRGKVMFGMARDHASDYAATHGCTWSIDKGALLFLPYGGTRGANATEAIVLNSATGMVGMPELTEAGVRVTCLLNPAIGWGTRIKIDNKLLTANSPGGSALNEPRFQPGYTAMNSLPGTDADGIYKCMYITHTGDTRGNPWYTTLIAVAIDPTAALPSVVPGVEFPP